MKAKLDGIWSSVLADGKSLPENPENFWVDIVAEIGVKGESVADMFNFQVCSPEWLNDASNHNNYIMEKNMIVMKKFDWDSVENIIQSFLDKLEEETWQALAQEIDRYGDWEFHKYKE
jgi:hypothetical protein